MHLWVIKRGLVDIEDFMAVAQQLLDNNAADDAGAAGDDYALFGGLRGHGWDAFCGNCRGLGEKRQYGAARCACCIFGDLYTDYGGYRGASPHRMELEVVVSALARLGNPSSIGMPPT